jgi:hypothetical protein
MVGIRKARPLRGAISVKLNRVDQIRHSRQLSVERGDNLSDGLGSTGG